MLSFARAAKIAAAWVSVLSEDKAALDRENALALPYGWLFPWNARSFLDDRSKLEEALVGNVPIFVDRVNGELLVTGAHVTVWREAYEKSIPPARLLMRPEPIHWDA
jgi:Immunity protein 35